MWVARCLAATEFRNTKHGHGLISFEEKVGDQHMQLGLASLPFPTAGISSLASPGKVQHQRPVQHGPPLIVMSSTDATQIQRS